MEGYAFDLVSATVQMRDSRVPNVNLVSIFIVTLFDTRTSSSDASVCAPSKLNFNGGYNCTGTSTSFTCSLICPDGAPFSFQPEPSYTCLYSEGEFRPKSIPECVTGNGIIIKGQEHSYRSYSKMDLMSMEWYSIFNGQ